MELMECDGCQTRTPAHAGLLEVPQGWRMFRVALLLGRVSDEENSHVLTFCEDCQASPYCVHRVLAEALGW
jgi:hypothetical protein